jgi:RNA polymerase sigma-70 factor, ECF subfamily
VTVFEKHSGGEIMATRTQAQDLAKNLDRASPPADDTIRRIADGDHAALGELYDRYAPMVTGLAVRILHDLADAEDVLQAVFLQVWRQASRYDAERGAPEAWLCTIARTRALDHLRRRVALREKHTTVTLQHAAAPSTVERLAVRRALGELRPTQRRALELAYYEGLTQTEIAARLNEPLGTIKTRIRGGMTRLRTALRPLSPPPRQSLAAAVR